MATRIRRNPALPLVLSVAAIGLSACGDGSGLETGGGAGDTDDVAPDSRLRVQPFVGVYDLGTDWLEPNGDEALLVIRPPEDDGIADALLYELDTFEGNCYLRPSTGTVFLDDFTGDVFMNDVTLLDRAILTLRDPATLSIEHGGRITGREVAEGRRVGTVESDLPRCR